MRIQTCLFLGVFLIVTAGPLMAATVTVEGIYSAEVAVENQSVATRRDAFVLALEKVLVKVSGMSDINAVPEVEEAVNRAQRYVRRYQYIQKAPPAVEPGLTADEPQLHIRVEFDGAALKEFLRNAGLPVWSSSRPAAIVWLAVQEPGKRYILGNDNVDAVKQMLEAAAERRGIPLIFPLLDLEDTRRVNFGDIRAGFKEPILAASERYNTAISLVGLLKLNRSGKATIKWTVYRDTVSSSWQNTQYMPVEALASGVNGLADILASRYAFAGGNSNQLFEFVVSVSDVLSLDDYAEILNYLDNLIFVEDVSPVRLEAGQVFYRVLMQGELSELQRSMTLFERVQPASPLSLPPLNTSSTGVSLQSVRERVDLYFRLRAR